MNKIHFRNHQQVIMDSLKNVEKEVLIAVAWLSFDIYQKIFLELASKDIKVKIIVNDDVINNRHKDTMALLEEAGIKIRKIRMFNPKKNSMHNKFCIIDKKKLLIGSFNWSKNANLNYENLMELKDYSLIKRTVEEFSYLWNLNSKIIKLQKQWKCSYCNHYKHNLLIINLGVKGENEYTEYKIVEVCHCEERNKELLHDYLSPFLSYSIYNLFNYYNEQMEQLHDYPEQLNILEDEYTYDLNRFLQKVQQELPIQGVALLAYEITSPNADGEWYTKVIWKDRFALDLLDSYEGTFNLI